MFPVNMLPKFKMINFKLIGLSKQLRYNSLGVLIEFLWFNTKTVLYQLTITLFKMHVGHYKCMFLITGINKSK